MKRCGMLVALLWCSGIALAQVETKLTASDAAADDSFGFSVSVNGDTAVIGARGDDSKTAAVYVFTRDAGGAWNEQAKLTASDAREQVP